ncbi:MAG: DMT family transporter [Pseudomonadota bacterium]
MVLGEVIRWRRALGIALAFAGVALIALRGDLFAHRAGLTLVAASAFVGALGLVAGKRLGTRLTALEMQAWFAYAALPVLWTLSLLLESGQGAALQAASPRAWAALAYTVLMSSLVAHSGYYWLVRRYPVTSVTPLTTLSPVFSITFGVLLLGESLSPQLLVGGLLTLLGVTIIALGEPSAADTGSRRGGGAAGAEAVRIGLRRRAACSLPGPDHDPQEDQLRSACLLPPRHRGRQADAESGDAACGGLCGQ